MRSGRRAAASLAVAMTVVVGPGVGAADTDGDPDNIAEEAPPIHLEQTAVLLKEGKPVIEGNYRFALAACQKAQAEATRDGGTVSLKPLPEETAKKLGRTFYHIWYEGRRMAVRTDSWDYAMPEGKLCEFQPVQDVELFIDEPGQALIADLTKGTATRQPSDGVVRYPLQPPTADDEAMKSKVVALLQKQGLGNMVPADEGQGEVAGQPCRRVESDLTGTACTWTGGEQWGFLPESGQQPEALAEGVSTGIPGDSILLSADPADGTGVRLTTESMTVGGAADESVFTAPAGLKIDQRE